MPVSDPRALLRRLLQEPRECQWLEFKSNNGDPQQIGRSISACANGAMLVECERAFIVWGVEDGTKKRIGTTINLGGLRKGNEPLENWLAHMVDPRLMLEFIDFEDDGKQFSIIVIEPTYDRPVKFEGKEYIRIGQQIKSLSDFPDHERSLWLATSKYKFEDAIALSHQSRQQIMARLNWESFYNLTGVEIPHNDDEILDCMIRRGYIKDDMEGGFDITNLGALLFASKIADFPTIRNKAVRVVKYKGADKSETEEETQGARGYAVGFPNMLKFIMEKLPKQERIVRGVRRTIPTYSEIAIREIVANALIHQDFTMSGAGPIIEIYSDRLEVSNPGSSLIERDRIIDDRRSRNEKFAAAMRELNICEERGSGIDKAIIDSEERHLQAPEFHSSSKSMRVVIYGPKQFSRLSRGEKVWSCFCHCVVRWLRRDYMSNTSLRRRFMLNDEDYQSVSAVIAAARKANKIVEAEQGQGKRNARYVPYWARQ